MKKNLTKDEQWLKFSAICIGIYLLVTVPLTLIFDWFTWHWFWFGFFVVYIPLAFFYMYFWSEKRIKPNEEQKKTATLNLCKYILLFWFYDLLYMAIFNQWLVLEYIFGIIAVIIIFSNLIKAFLSGIKFFKWMLPFDLLCGVGLSVYLIYRIPNETLQTIVLTIVAALYGGLLTLVGVAWTIQRQNQEKKDEEIKKFKPVLSVYNDSLAKENYLLQCNNFKENKSIKFNQNEKNKYAYLINDFSLLNIDYASLFIQGLIINQAYLFYRNTNLYIDKNKIMKFSFNNQKIYTPKKIQTMGILLKDLLGNEYVLGLGLDFDKTVKEYIKINVFDTKKMIPFDRRGGNSK